MKIYFCILFCQGSFSQHITLDLSTARSVMVGSPGHDRGADLAVRGRPPWVTEQESCTAVKQFFSPPSTTPTSTTTATTTLQVTVSCPNPVYQAWQVGSVTQQQQQQQQQQTRLINPPAVRLRAERSETAARKPGVRENREGTKIEQDAGRQEGKGVEEREMMQAGDSERGKRHRSEGLRGRNGRRDYVRPCLKRIMRWVELSRPSVANPSVHLAPGEQRTGQTAWHTFVRPASRGPSLFLKKIMTTSAIKSDTDTLAVGGQPHRIPTDESSLATYLRTQRDVTSLSSWGL